MKLLSVIIPCYNSAAFLPDALHSISLYGGDVNVETIVVDDGSTDPATLALLDDIAKSQCVVISQENKGPAGARNTGVRSSKGEYLLFLDSDNKIRKDYIDKAVSVLESNEKIDIVYANPAFFGDVSDQRFFASQEYDLTTILMGNYIDMCTVMRKQVWEDLGGFDENRIIIGHEDWEFWIRAGAAGKTFYYLNETLFDYRVRENSLIKAASDPASFKRTYAYVLSKHLDVFLHSYDMLFRESSYYKKDQASPFRTFIKFFYNKYLSGKKS